MNSTLGSHEAQSAPVPDAETHLSRASVIGMFLILQLCQVTQPYGSLLFREAGGFFWRCNPLSSFVEGCIIYWHLVATIIHCGQEGLPGIFKRLQEASAGLLLLRGASGRSDVAGPMQKLMTGSFLDKVEKSDYERPTSDPVAPIDPRSKSATEESEYFTCIRPEIDPKSEKARILREAFGSNALAHKELRIDLSAAFTELCILVKVVVICPDGWFTTGAVFLVLGWIAVQTLLICFHRKEMDEMEMATAVRLARTLNAELNEQQRWWTTFFIILHLPFFGYPAYLAAFRPWFPADAAGFFGSLRTCGSYIRVAIAFNLALSCASGGLGVGIFACIAPVSRAGQIKLLILLIVLSAWLWASSFSFVLNSNFLEADGDTSDSPFFFEQQTPMYYLVDQSYAFMYKVFWLLVFLCLIAFVYAKTLFHRRGDLQTRIETNAWDSLAEGCSTLFDRKRTSLGNAIYVLVIFIIYVIYYDAERTQKPP